MDFSQLLNQVLGAAQKRRQSGCGQSAQFFWRRRTDGCLGIDAVEKEKYEEAGQGRLGRCFGFSGL